MSGLILLAHVAHLTRTLEIRCARCARKGRLSMARMVALHGLDAPVWHVWRDLNHDCPNRDGSTYNRCSLHCPDLARLV